MQYLIGIVVVVLLIGLLIKIWYVPVAALIIWAAWRISLNIRKNKYFESEEFQNHVRSLSSFTNEHNQIASYAEQLRNGSSFDIGRSSVGSQSQFATSENTSHYNYRRDRNVATYQDSHVHPCSLQVVRNAEREPLKYLIKYFHIPVSEDGVSQVESLGEQISRLESAVDNLSQREAEIKNSISPPSFILKHFENEFMSKVGVSVPSIDIPYPVYTFEYVSAGGNSSQRSTTTLNSPAIDGIIEMLSTKVRFKNSAAGQRALMTRPLREHIKKRDNFTCQNCSISIFDEPHLLLEVDHILPVSRGGLSTEDNLQTLCWKCNRSKSNKLV